MQIIIFDIYKIIFVCFVGQQIVQKYKGNSYFCLCMKYMSKLRLFVFYKEKMKNILLLPF